MFGDTVAIGAGRNQKNRGHIRVYTWDGLAWNQKGQDLDGTSNQDFLGRTLSMSADGSILAAGAPGKYNQGPGYVRVWKWMDGLWAQLGSDIAGEFEGDTFGTSVSVSFNGEVLAVGARYNDQNGENSGQVKIFEWTGESWAQRGQSLMGELAGDDFGASISMSSDGGMVAIGAPHSDKNGSTSGHVRVLEWSGSAWIQRGQDLVGNSQKDRSGFSVSMSADGTIVAIGGHYNGQNGGRSGHVWVWEWNGSTWTQKGNDILGENANDYSGQAVALSLDGSSVAIGAPRFGANSTMYGQVRVFEWSGTSWDQRGQAIVGKAPNDRFGSSLALSWNGGILAVGAPLNDGNGLSSGHVRVYQWTEAVP